MKGKNFVTNSYSNPYEEKHITNMLLISNFNVKIDKMMQVRRARLNT